MGLGGGAGDTATPGQLPGGLACCRRAGGSSPWHCPRWMTVVTFREPGSERARRQKQPLTPRPATTHLPAVASSRRVRPSTSPLELPILLTTAEAQRARNALQQGHHPSPPGDHKSSTSSPRRDWTFEKKDDFTAMYAARADAFYKKVLRDSAPPPPPRPVSKAAPDAATILALSHDPALVTFSHLGHHRSAALGAPQEHASTKMLPPQSTTAKARSAFTLAAITRN